MKKLPQREKMYLFAQGHFRNLEKGEDQWGIAWSCPNRPCLNNTTSKMVRVVWPGACMGTGGSGPRIPIAFVWPHLSLPCPHLF